MYLSDKLVMIIIILFYYHIADDRGVWKAKLRKGAEYFEKRLIYELNDKREKRKLRSCHSKTLAN